MPGGIEVILTTRSNRASVVSTARLAISMQIRPGGAHSARLPRARYVANTPSHQVWRLAANGFNRSRVLFPATVARGDKCSRVVGSDLALPGGKDRSISALSRAERSSAISIRVVRTSWISQSSAASCEVERGSCESSDVGNRCSSCRVACRKLRGPEHSERYHDFWVISSVWIRGLTGWDRPLKNADSEALSANLLEGLC